MWSVILAIGLAALATSALPSGPLAQSQAKPRAPLTRADGRALFLEHCASCHGATARGDGPVASSLRDFPGDLTQFAKRNGGVFPSAKVLRIIEGRDVGAHGSGEMPVWGHVFRRMPSETSDGSATERIEAIVRYLESIQERAGDEGPVGDPGTRFAHHLAAFLGAPSAGSGVDDVQINRPQLSSACESNGR